MTAVRASLAVTLGVLAMAVLVYVARFVLLLINRDTLLHPVIAAIGVWLGRAVSLAAIAAVIACTVLLIWWLIARRAAAFAHHGLSETRSRSEILAGCLAPPTIALVSALVFSTVLDHRPSWAMWAICLALCSLPLVVLVWVLTYVIELATVEQNYTRLRKPIMVWWIAWILSIATSVFATTTSGVSDAEGIANNTIATMLAYLLAMAAVRATAKVFEGFESKPVERPAHRWIIVADEPRAAPTSSTLESKGQEPAA